MFGTAEILILALAALLIGTAVIGIRRLIRTGRRQDSSASGR